MLLGILFVIFICFLLFLMGAVLSTGRSENTAMKIMKYIVSSPFVLLAFFMLWLVAAANLPVLENGWHLLTGRGYKLPEGSSVFSFRTTVMNPGSGEWWLYGEDSTYYYYLDGTTKISKKNIENCPGFKTDDHTTWCTTTTRDRYGSESGN